MKRKTPTLPICVPGCPGGERHDREPHCQLQVKRLTEKAVVPARASPGAAGYDLFADVDMPINPGERLLTGTGVAVAVPEGHYGRVAPRSGLSTKGIDVGAGVVDSDYRGEVHVLLINNGREVFWVRRGDRVAQLILEKCTTCPISVVDKLDETDRGDRGFGSSGTNRWL